MKRLLLLAAVLLAVGCSHNTPTPAATTATTAAAGPAAFLADVAHAGFGTKDASDPAFVNVGNTACQGLTDGVSYGQQVTAFVESAAHPNREQAETLVRSAVRNLCPERSGMLP
jgi:hypothetical protein